MTAGKDFFFLTGFIRSRPDGIIPPNAPRIETPEELEAWINARKKNWPSKENVERKVKKKFSVYKKGG